MLGLLAFVPLVGLAVLAFGRLSEVQRANDELGQLASATDELVELVEIETALQNEAFWSAAAFAIDRFGVSESLVATFLGVQPSDETASAIQRTDRLVDLIALPGLASDVDEARAASVPLSGGPQALDVIARDSIGPALDRKTGEVISLAARQSDGASLVSVARMLEGTNDLRSGFAALRAAFFDNFGIDANGDRDLARRRLSDEAAIYRDRLARLQLNVPDNNLIGIQLETLMDDPAWLELSAAIDQFLTESDSAPDVATALRENPEMLAPIASTFSGVNDVSDLHLDLVEGAASALAGEVGQARTTAGQDGWRVGLMAAAIFVFTVGGIVTVTRWIVRPLGDLGRTAQSFSESGAASLRPSSGPAEIRLIHDALAEAISNLERTERQAMALRQPMVESSSTWLSW